jgi:ligand-binding sensor domain-containing protein
MDSNSREIVDLSRIWGRRESSKMRLITLLFTSILFVLTSCSGQTSSQAKNSMLNDHNHNLAIGDTVSELDKSIWIVFQDRNDHFWFGSDGKGVYRYDGKAILHFSTKDGLLSDRIRAIQEDKSGNVFITSLEGINKFDGQKFTPIPVTESNVWKLDSNDLWFSVLGKEGESGPYRYDGKVLHHLKFPKHYMEDEYYKVNGRKSWSPYEPYTIYKDSNGNIWFGTSEFGICRYDGKSLSWMYEKHLTLIEDGGSFGIRSIVEDKEGKFWFCNTSNRYTIFPASLVEDDKILIDYKREKGIKELKSPEGREMIYFMSVVEDNEGDLWMVTYEQGVWRYDGRDVTHYDVKDGIKSITLFSIYKDNHGDLWLGTHDSGVYKYNGEEFQKFEL